MEAHGVDVFDYSSNLRDVASQELLVRVGVGKKPKSQRSPVTDFMSQTVKVCGIPLQVNYDVEESACLPAPEGGYIVPEHGELRKSVTEAVVAYKNNRSTWAWGPTGSGKDALYWYLSRVCRRPALQLQIVQGASIEGWKFTRGISKEGAVWEEGVLLRYLRDGYTSLSGRKVPYLVLISDFDRASRQQVEELRGPIDSLEGRVVGPTGESHKVLPGTTFVATANSVGQGDQRGSYVSANVVDASIMGRFKRKVAFYPMDPLDEGPILTARFPEVHARFPEAIPTIMKCVVAIRQEIGRGNLFMEFSHRDACNWVEAVGDLIPYFKLSAHEAVKSAARVTVYSTSSDPHTVMGLKRCVDPHVRKGAVS